MTRPRPRGLALATVLIVVFLVLVFCLSLASLATARHQLAIQGVARTRAFEAAQAGLSAATARLSADQDWGRNRESIAAQVASDGIRYAVTFDSGLGVPWSLNNLAGNAVETGYRGRVVPPRTALLVARAQYPGDPPDRRRTLESLVRYSSFPYALAGSGSVRTGSSLTVAGVADLSQVLSATLLEEAHVYAGSTASGSFSSGGLSRITGLARTPGTVQVGFGSAVIGGVENGVEPDALPLVDIARYNNAGLAGTTELAAGTYLLPQVIQGSVHVSGDLVLRGGAVMRNATLYVDGGSLTSDAPITGTGTIFVTGNATLAAAANVVLQDGVALFTGGDLELRALGVGVQVFQGVLYSRSNIRVSDGIQVIGTVLASSSSGAGNVELGNSSSVVHLPEYTQLRSVWETLGMRGSLLAGDLPLMTVLSWGEAP